MTDPGQAAQSKRPKASTAGLRRCFTPQKTHRSRAPKKPLDCGPGPDRQGKRAKSQSPPERGCRERSGGTDKPEGNGLRAKRRRARPGGGVACGKLYRFGAAENRFPHGGAGDTASGRR